MQEWEMGPHAGSIDFQEYPFRPVSVLSMQEWNGSLLVGWIDRFEYREVISSLFIEYDYQLGECEEHWTD